jgi:outer membrane protein TolC
MYRMRIIKILVLVIAFICCINTFAQSTNKKSTDQASDFNSKLLNIELPPLDSLFASARMYNALLLSQDMLIEVAVRTMISERNNWWKFVNLYATYSYGMMASLVDITSGGVPVNPQYSRQAQNWWNIGASVSIPLNELFDRGNRIRKEKATIRKQEYDFEVKFDELKVQIAQAYSQALLSLSLSKSLYESYQFSKAQFEIAEKDFFAGRIPSKEMVDSKNQEVNSYIILQKEISNLIHYASLLETYSKVPILNQ